MRVKWAEPHRKESAARIPKFELYHPPTPQPKKRKLHMQRFSVMGSAMGAFPRQRGPGASSARRRSPGRICGASA